MQISHIPLAETGILPSLIADYISAKDSIKQFYNLLPDIANFSIQIKHKQQHYKNRNVLVDVLQQQYARFTTTDTVKNNIQSLLHENTFTVTTAHQTNIFTGTMYYIYKILHVVKLADELKQQYPKNNFVPVYWMGCEDHDFEEINHIHLFGEKLVWNDKQGGATGRYNPHSLAELITTLRTTLSNEPYSEAIISIFEKGYTQHDDLATATQYILNELFGKYGLLVLNPDEPALKKLFTHAIEDELLHQTVFNQTASSISELEKLGYKPQANPRAINLFYLDGNIRERIVQHENGEYEILNTTLKFSKDELLQLVKTNPEKFSPNVFLRPLYQETVLPNLAYIGGSGELSYWLEQKNIFDYFKTPYPLLLLRNSFMLIDAATRKKLNKLQLPLTEYFADEDTLIKKYISANSNLPDFETERNELQKVFQQIKEKAVKVDVTLQATAEAQLQQALNNLENLEKKIIKAEKNKQDIALNQLKAVRNKLMPNNILQERYENILPYFAKYDKDMTAATLYKAIQPLEIKMVVIDLP